MTWTGQSFSEGQVLTAVNLNNLQNDITAQANGDSGAPKNALASMASNSVDRSQIVSSAVTQSKLSTAMSEVSDATAGPTDIALPGGEYGFYPQVKSAASSSHQFIIADDFSGTSYVTNIAIDRQTGSGTGSAQHRYIQASPPYDLGDGQIPLFIFLLLDNNGKIVATYVAPEAPWHLNGVTDIRAERYADGKSYRMVKDLPANLLAQRPMVETIKVKMRASQVIDGVERALLRDFFSATAGLPLVEEEITQEMKQADMDSIPHPFMANDLTDRTVVLLDPLSGITLNLLELMQLSEFEVTEILMGDFFNISNTALTRQGPAGVMQVGFSWR